MRRTATALTLSILCLFALPAWGATPFEAAVKQWGRIQNVADASYGNFTDITAVYCSAQYVEALIQSEADKNLWTADETDRYRYQLLSTLNLQEQVAIHLSFDNRGSALRMAPFDKQIKLWIGKKSYEPVDFDRRFNFKLNGKFDGYVYFPRYDDKGKDMLEGVNTLRLELDGGAIPAADGRRKITFVWDIYKDDPQALYQGKAMARLELDRLLKRVEKLSGEKGELQAKLAEIEQEIREISARIEELQKQ
ncbi:hypothetical protein [Aminirod propionatiphilus]|uniref:Uncharacterized protein n=1 Tax=Aminirod propionatiphilus TaxID=3415223 RepID=A0ACD1DXA7_9BACT|nr:hypothetical protein KIH16_03305 [Synergistota bacterium]